MLSALSRLKARSILQVLVRHHAAAFQAMLLAFAQPTRPYTDDTVPLCPISLNSVAPPRPTASGVSSAYSPTSAYSPASGAAGGYGMSVSPLPKSKDGERLRMDTSSIIELVLTSLGGAETIVSASTASRISDIKVQIASVVKTPPEVLCLLFHDGAILKDSQLLQSYGPFKDNRLSLTLVKSTADEWCCGKRFTKKRRFGRQDPDSDCDEEIGHDATYLTLSSDGTFNYEFRHASRNRYNLSVIGQGTWTYDRRACKVIAMGTFVEDDHSDLHGYDYATSGGDKDVPSREIDETDTKTETKEFTRAELSAWMVENSASC